MKITSAMIRSLIKNRYGKSIMKPWAMLQIAGEAARVTTHLWVV